MPQAQPRRHGPVDPDVDAADSRPLHLRPRYVYVVFLGGVLGTGGRWLADLIAGPAQLVVATLAVNLIGAFALGWLTGGLLRAGEDRGWLRLARLHFGTGFCGGFTTYSAFSVDVVTLAERAPLVALALAVGTVVVGALLAWAGLACAKATTRAVSRP